MTTNNTKFAFPLEQLKLSIII